MVFIWASKLASGSLWFCFTAPCNWLEKLTPVSQPMGTHTIHLLWLVRVICYFCLGFTTFIWKPYRAAVKPNHIWNEKFLLKTSLLTMGPLEEETFKITFERRQAHLHVISWTLSICHVQKIDWFQESIPWKAIVVCHFESAHFIRNCKSASSKWLAYYTYKLGRLQVDSTRTLMKLTSNGW